MWYKYYVEEVYNIHSYINSYVRFSEESQMSCQPQSILFLCTHCICVHDWRFISNIYRNYSFERVRKLHCVHYYLTYIVEIIVVKVNRDKHMM